MIENQVLFMWVSIESEERIVSKKIELDSLDTKPSIMSKRALKLYVPGL